MCWYAIVNESRRLLNISHGGTVVSLRDKQPKKWITAVLHSEDVWCPADLSLNYLCAANYGLQNWIFCRLTVIVHSSYFTDALSYCTHCLTHVLHTRELCYHIDCLPCSALCSMEMSATESQSAPRKWTSDEDQRLCDAVEEHSDSNWKMIAEKVTLRSDVQCFARWRNVLRPGLQKGPWGSDEDDLLMFLLSRGFRDWSKLAQHMPGRTGTSCRDRWHRIDPSLGMTDG